MSKKKPNVTEKRHYLMNIFSRNRTLFFRVFKEHIAEFMPIVYDPGIAESIRGYSEFFVTPQNAAYLSIVHPEQMETAIRNAAEGRDIDLIVVTDAEAILGIGDWGTNGVSISVGKLMVYTAAAGLDPARVLPVVLDAGTNRESLLQDPLYLGLHEKRVTGTAYDDFVDRFVALVEGMFPHLYLHFEDFGRSHAAKILNRYVDRYPVFMTTLKEPALFPLPVSWAPSGFPVRPSRDQTYLCFGAGTAGCGIAHRIYQEMLDQGLTEKEARQKFYLVDRQGLLFEDMDDLTPEQKPFARKRSEFADASHLTTLEAAVKVIHPTILVGTSTQSGAFTERLSRKWLPIRSGPSSFRLATRRNLPKLGPVTSLPGPKAVPLSLRGFLPSRWNIRA